MPHGRRHVTQDDPQRDGDPAGVGVHAIVVPLWQQVDVVVPQRKTCQSDCSTENTMLLGNPQQATVAAEKQHYAVRCYPIVQSDCSQGNTMLLGVLWFRGLRLARMNAAKQQTVSMLSSW